MQLLDNAGATAASPAQRSAEHAVGRVLAVALGRGPCVRVGPCGMHGDEVWAHAAQRFLQAAEAVWPLLALVWPVLALLALHALLTHLTPPSRLALRILQKLGDRLCLRALLRLVGLLLQPLCLGFCGLSRVRGGSGHSIINAIASALACSLLSLCVHGLLEALVVQPRGD